MKASFPMLVSADWLNDHLSDPDLIILDATLPKPGGILPETAKSGTIPGARFFDIKGAFSDPFAPIVNTLPGAEDFTTAAQELGINDSSKIIVYDDWGVYSSPRAWWMFRAMGHQQVAVLDGGLPAWQEAGFASDVSTSEIINKGNFSAKAQPGWKKTIDDIVQNLNSKEQLVLDARSAGRFTASVPEPRAGLRGGHIPGSKSLPYSELLKDGKFKSIQELRSIFQNLNVKSKPMISSCGSGVTAAVILFAAHYAGIDNIALYDGSWTEYAQRLDLPVEK